MFWICIGIAIIFIICITEETNFTCSVCGEEYDINDMSEKEGECIGCINYE